MEQEWKRFYDSGLESLRDGNFKTAESMWLAALGQAESFGEKDPRFSMTLEYLADTCWYLGDFNQVEAISRRLLSIYRSTLNQEHFRVGKLAYRLATLYHFQQKFGLAEPLYKQVMTIMMKSLGSNHPELARVMDDYADLLKTTHREDQAEYIKQCANSIKLGKWGAPEARGKEEEKKKPQQKPQVREEPAVNVQEETRVPPQPAQSALPRPSHLATSGNGEGAVKGGNVSSESAQGARATVAASNAPVSGTPAAGNSSTNPPPGNPLIPGKTPAMPSGAKSDGQAPGNQSGPASIENEWNQFRTMAEKATSEGDLESAERLWTSALKRAEKLGTKDQRFVYCLDNLADVLSRMEKHFMAEPHLKRSLDIKREVLGRGHTVVAVAANNLAKLHYMQGHYREAEIFGQECIDTYERALGPDHPDVATSLHNLATLFHIQCKYSDAETCYKRGLAIRMKVMGEDHPETARIKKNYADLLKTINRAEEAEALTRKATGLITGEWSVITIPSDESLVE